jgi:N,N-dimethylformamidase beta subunit-like protein
MNLAFVLLLVSTMLLPHILGCFLSFNISTQYIHSNIVVYAQNYTSDKSSITTGISTPEKGLPPVSLHALPKSQQSQILHKKSVPLLAVLHSQTYKKGSRIALIVPVFTGAAYNYAFYIFYKHFASVRAGENVTHHLSLLSSLVTKPKVPKIPNYAAISASAYAMRYLDRHLSLLTPKNKISVLTDIDVDSGSIFMNNNHSTNRYDILILGHQEYVTQQEYSNLKKFVANGGTMILLDGNVFYAQVGYDRSTQTITLIKGHGWAFNGKSAWKSVGERWRNETSQWVGSNSLCTGCKITFVNNPFNYYHREEQYITNANDTIFLNYNASVLSPNPKIVKNATSAHANMIATYELSYKKGKVIGLGIYSDVVINNRYFLVFLDHLLQASQPSK